MYSLCTGANIGWCCLFVGALKRFQKGVLKRWAKPESIETRNTYWYCVCDTHTITTCEQSSAFNHVRFFLLLRCHVRCQQCTLRLFDTCRETEKWRQRIHWRASYYLSWLLTRCAATAAARDQVGRDDSQEQDALPPVQVDVVIILLLWIILVLIIAEWKSDIHSPMLFPRTRCVDLSWKLD